MITKAASFVLVSVSLVSVVVDSFAPLAADTTTSSIRRITLQGSFTWNRFTASPRPFHAATTPSSGIHRVVPARRQERGVFMSSLSYDDGSAAALTGISVTGTDDLLVHSSADVPLDDDSSLNSNLIPVTHLGLQQQQQQTEERNVLGWTLAAGLSAAILAYELASHNTALAHQIAHFPDQLWDQYSSILAHHPVGTKACTSGFVYTVGDVIAQRTEQQQQQQGTTTTSAKSLQWDMARTARSATAGFVGHGPLSHCWYNVCDHLFNDVLHWTAWWSTLPKIAVDQTVWGPIWNNTYLLFLGLLQRQSLAVIWDDVRRSTIPLVVSGLKLWPAAHVITYGLLPTEHRLLWVDLVEIVWVTILATQAASLSHQHGHDPQEQQQQENDDQKSLLSDETIPRTTVVPAMASTSGTTSAM